MTIGSGGNLARQANAHFHARNLGQAEALARQALGVNKKDSVAMTILGLVAFEQSRLEEAERWHRKAIAANRAEPLCQCNLAKTFLARGRLGEAMTCFERALKITPGLIQAVTGRATVFERRGRLDRALALIGPIVNRGEATPEIAALFAQILFRRGEDRRLVEFAQQQLERPEVVGVERRSLLLLLGRTHDRLGDADAAFDAYRQGNAVNAQPFDLDGARAYVDRLKQVFSASTMSRLPRASTVSELPVFIVSMPRAGSTLVEQIIHAHPKAHGAGELRLLTDVLRSMPEVVDSPDAYPHCALSLQAAHADRLAATYLKGLRPHHRGALRIVNKSLQNYFHLGIIRLLLPGARVIHVHRHPLDMCLSCYMQDLSPITHPYTTDLANLGLYYREYRRIIDHWRGIPDVTMLELQYEDIVADLQAAARRIVDFLGLDWDENCLRFHEAKRDVANISYDQVRRPIYRSAVARYRRYEKHLGPLVEALGDALVEADRVD